MKNFFGSLFWGFLNLKYKTIVYFKINKSKFIYLVADCITYPLSKINLPIAGFFGNVYISLVGFIKKKIGYFKNIEILNLKSIFCGFFKLIFE